MKTTLYQIATNGKIKEWSIEVIPEENRSKIAISSGYFGGKTTVNVSIVESGKNLGKANETTHYEQAKNEANSKIAEKIRSGYVTDIKDAKSSETLGSGIPAPMLAHKYCKDGSQKGSKTLEQLKLVGKPIFVQPKLDGNRCLIKIENRVPKMYTRAGDLMPVQLEHILNSISNFPDVILDGELYSDELSFNTLNGLIKRVKVTPEEKEKRKMIYYHIYDVMSNYGYEKRKEMIEIFESPYIIPVPTIEINHASDEEIEKYLFQFMNEGYEGLMIRQMNMPYDNKRSWQLCKVKVFEDEEFQLVGFIEDVRGGFVGSFQMKDLKTGKTFNAGASGQSIEDRREMWNNQDLYLGEMATVEFFGYSEYGIPRFPKFKGIRKN